MKSINSSNSYYRRQIPKLSSSRFKKGYIVIQLLTTLKKAKLLHLFLYHHCASPNNYYILSHISLRVNLWPLLH